MLKRRKHHNTEKRPYVLTKLITMTHKVVQVRPPQYGTEDGENNYLISKNG